MLRHFSRLSNIYQAHSSQLSHQKQSSMSVTKQAGMNFYLISQITSAHLTSNSMLCDNKLLCPRTLFRSPISSWLGSPQPREATKLSLFQHPGVHKEPRLGPNNQSHLYCCLDSTSPRPASTCTSAAASGCSMPRFRGRSCVTLLVSTKRTADFHLQVTSPLKTCLQVLTVVHTWIVRPELWLGCLDCFMHSLFVFPYMLLSSCLVLWLCHFIHSLSLTSHVTSQDVLASAPLTFTLKLVTSQDGLASAPLTFTLKSVTSQYVLASTPLLSLTSHCWFLPFRRLATVARFSFRGAVILLLWAWYCRYVPRVLCVERPLWAWFCLWCSICSDTATHSPGLGRSLRFPILFMAQVPAQTSSSLQRRCHLNKWTVYYSLSPC